MNFIDRALENHLHGDDFLQAMAEIDSENQVRDILYQYPQFVRDVITIIDYDGELQIGGLDEVIHGNLEERLPELLQALERCGASQEAVVLQKAKNMPPEQYEKEYEALYGELALNQDNDGFWDSVRNYINASLQS